MTITSSSGHKSPNGFPTSWIDFNTVKNTGCVVFNIFLYRNSTTYLKYTNLSSKYLGYVSLTNGLFRILNSVIAFRNKNYWKIALDVVAFSSLFFPRYGIKAAIMADFTSEAINIYTKFFNNNGLDCTVHENALQVFGLSEEESKNKETLEKRYNDLCTQWDDRIEKSKSSPLLLEKFTKLRNQVEISYKTLLEGSVSGT